MSWFNVWDGLKNKICRYLLQRYLGQFLEEKLNLEQLKIELYNGKATIKNVSLKVEALNELFESQGWAVQVIEGHIGLLTVVVPWNALMTDDSFVEVSDLIITLRPVKRQYDAATSTLESMWSSVSSSMQLAEECMKQKDEKSDNQIEIQLSTIVGLEKFAETIDNVLNRIKAKLTNTVITLEHPSVDGSKGMAVDIRIKILNYSNETGSDKQQQQMNDSSEGIIGSKNFLPTFAKHTIVLEGLQLSTREFKFKWSNMDDADPDTYFEIQRHRSLAIPFVEVSGVQKMQIKMKQSEEVGGPKVLMDIDVGPIHTLVTPRQIHLLMQFLEAFNTAEPSQMKPVTKRVQYLDYMAFPQQQHQNNTTKIFCGQENWGGGGDCRGIVESLACESLYSKGSSHKYCDSLASSTTSTSTYIRQPRNLCNQDVSGEIVSFNMRIASFSLLIIQEDILFESGAHCNDILSEQSQDDMLLLSTSYFSQRLSQSADAGFDPCSDMFHEKNYVLLKVVPAFAEGIQERQKNILLTKLVVTITKLDLLEIINGIETPVILFNRVQNHVQMQQPDVKLIMNSTASSCKTKDSTPPTRIDIALTECTLECDITLYDRLSGLLAPSPFELSYSNNGGGPTHLDDIAKSSTTKVNITSPKCNARLRFPIVDTRPTHDLGRIPWWKKNIRADYLLFTFHHLRLDITNDLIDVKANQIDCYYCETETAPAQVCLLKTRMKKNEKLFTGEHKFEYPQLIVSLRDNKQINEYIRKYAQEDNRVEISSNLSFVNAKKPHLPFASQRVYRHSDTVHNKADVTNQSETILMPGETDEINQFSEFTFKTSKLQIEISLPIADIILESKQLYELIYNRLNTDLFMWEPSSFILKNPAPSHKMRDSILNANLMDSLYIPSQTSATLNNSSYDDESIYFSLHEPAKGQNHKMSSPLMPSPSAYAKSSECSVRLSIGHGCLTFYVPKREEDGHVHPSEQLGKFNFIICGMQFFMVSGYAQDTNLGYVCIQLEDLEAFHCGQVPMDVKRCLEYWDNFLPAEYMKSTLFKTPKGLTKNTHEPASASVQYREMVSVIIEMRKVPEQRIKRITIAAGIHHATLRYNPDISNLFWLNQLLDFLDVADYPIEGYQPLGVITEVQFHLWNCSMDYRPLYLPYRVILEIELFSVCSNIISSASGCNLHFVIEECVFSLAPNCHQSDESSVNGTKTQTRILPAKDLVPVLDVALIDISLRISEQATKKCPKLDLRCSIHDAHMRTCSDSCSAIAQLIAYIAKDGDFAKVNEKESRTPSPVNSIDDLFSSSNHHLTIKANDIMAQKQQERVNTLMAEALQETTAESSINETTLPAWKLQEQGIEMFYFPDEGNKPQAEHISRSDKEEAAAREYLDILNYENNVLLTSLSVAREETEESLAQVKADLGELQKKTATATGNDIFTCSDEDYCVIADDEKSYLKKYGIKNITISEDPLRIVDNHFHLPTNKPDLLRSPENFPMAVYRYTLCEMTFTWHLYAGKDFPQNTPATVHKEEKRSKSKMSDIYMKGISCPKNEKNPHTSKKPKEKITWKTRGGVERNHEVLVEMQFTKVRLSHEVYPPYTYQASRQVLLVNDIEIRDRLQTSDINKFLYHPNMKKIPNKSMENMVIIKALHIRPNPEISSIQECSLRISLLPLRLHIDQDTLLFLGEFFASLGDNYSETNEKDSAAAVSLEPVMLVNNLEESVSDCKAREMVQTNLDLLMEDETSVKSGDKSSRGCGTRTNTIGADDLSETLTATASSIYFREIIFSPDVPICFDYHGRRIELSRGPVAGLIMGLGQLQCSEINLRKLVNRRGLLGVDKLFLYLLKEWLSDIKRNQLPKILSGVGPTYAFVQLFQGVYDLFWLPIEQYQKDGRLIKGLQLGAQSFTARTALAALEITTRIIQLLQFTAETAFDMVSPGPSVRQLRKHKKGRKRRILRPKDIREGVTNAYLIVKEGINDSANTLIETTVTEHDQKGYTGAVGAVVRQIPQLMVCPAVLATQATTNILGGVKSSLVPDAQFEAREKWKENTD